MSEDSGKASDVPPPNPQHLAWFNEGVESWNRRRNAEPFKPELMRVVFDNGAWSEIASTVHADWHVPLGDINDFSRVNLTGADLRESILNRGAFNGAIFESANLTDAQGLYADFTGADFRGAELWKFSAEQATFNGADFRGATLFRECPLRFHVPLSKFVGADFSGCDLCHADLSGGNFKDAKFTDANLGGANLFAADLKGAELSGSQLWRAQMLRQSPWSSGLNPSERFLFPELRSLSKIPSLRQHLLDVYKNDSELENVAFYFRGEPCTRFPVSPSVMRGGLRRFERDLLMELKTESPAAFSGCEYAIDELAIARHIGLPTRLLDVTRNPLVGLYWATGKCESEAPPPQRCLCKGVEGLRDCSCMRPHGACDGRLHVFALPRSMVCSYDSDRISIVANFARLPILQQERLLTKRQDEVEFKYLGTDKGAWDLPRVSMKESKTTLLDGIRREKPYFTDDIDVRDLFRVFVVEARRSFDRIRAQSGAFMLSAYHQSFEGTEVTKCMAKTELYDHHVVKIPVAAKDELRRELDWVGINRPALFPDVESVAEAVTRRYSMVADRLERAAANNE